MDDLLIKLRFEPKCDEALIKYLQPIPKRRRAEQVRRLLTLALNLTAAESSPCKTPSSSTTSVNHEKLDDEELFANDMLCFSISKKEGNNDDN